MRILFLLSLAGIVACNNAQDANQQASEVLARDSVRSKEIVPGKPAESTVTQQKTDTADASDKVYSNERFKEVSVTKTGNDTYRVTGKAQVFEATFSWVVEDGHNELKQGHEMTDAGAPEFGNFSFAVKVGKAEPNTTLHLILFEASAKDGSRQHELAVPLP